MRKTLFALVVSLGCTLSLHATSFQVFYTFNASPDVYSSTYSSISNALSGSLAIGTNPSGADGILIGPNSTLIYGGETGSHTVFQITQTLPDTAPFPIASNTGTLLNDFLVADQNPTAASSTVYTFDNNGQIASAAVTGGQISTTATAHTVTGADINVSDIFWNAAGTTAYYLDQGTGNLGVINLATYVTSASLFSGITTAQSAVYDPFTGLVDLFGNGFVNTFNPTTSTLGTAVALNSASPCSSLSLGAVDGAGHAFAACGGNLYYIDYSATGNILSGSDIRQTDIVGNIKDVAVIPGTTTPEPSSVAMFVFGLGCLAIGRRRRKV